MIEACLHVCLRANMSEVISQNLNSVGEIDGWMMEGGREEYKDKGREGQREGL